MPSPNRTTLNLLPFGLLALIATLFSLPLFEHLGYWGIQDWDWFLLYDGVTRDSVVRHGQVPLWNPYMKGGMPLLANPESNILSPSFLVQLLVDVVVAAKINIALHLFLGLCGTYCLARHYRLGVVASCLAALVFMLNSMYALTLTVGMEWGYAIAYLPWAFYFYLKAAENFSFTLAASLVLAVMWLSGGVYPFTIGLLLLGTHGLLAVVFREYQWQRTTLLLITIYGLTFLLGAVKFFPAIEFTQQYTRHSDLYAGYSLESLGYGLFGRDQTLAAILDKSREPGFWRGFSQSMDEVGMYIGVIPFALALVGAWFGRRVYRTLLIALAIFLWLSLGNRSEPFALWSLLREVPPYSIMRSVERFRFVVVLVIALLAGSGLQVLVDRLAQSQKKRQWSALTGVAITSLVLVDLFLVNGPIFKDAFPIPPIETPENHAFLQIGGFPEYDRNGPRTPESNPLYTTYGAAFPAFLAKAGSVYGYESIPVPEKAIILDSPEYRGEVFLEGTGGTASYRLWSPNRLVVDLQAEGEGLVVINQNYYPGWRAKGMQVEQVRGLLAVRVTPQVTTVELSYRPTSFLLGAITSGLTALGMALWYWRRRTRVGRVNVHEAPPPLTGGGRGGG